MGNFDIAYRQCGKYCAVICAASYLNPIEDIRQVSTELKKHLPAGCYVLFDLLLSNGDSFNRFAEGFFDGDGITPDSISVISAPEGELGNLNLHYHGKIKELNRSVLSEREKRQFAR